MKRLVILLLVFGPLGFGPLACSKHDENADEWSETSTPDATPDAIAADQRAMAAPDVRALVQSNNEFAFDLFRWLSHKDGNVVLSPYSIATALAMTYAGARGPTADQMAQTLHFTLNSEALHPACASLLRHFHSNGKARPYELFVANALWGQRGFPLEASFVGLLRDRYHAAMRPVDFARDAEGARQTINRWVDDRTRHKIPDLLPPGVLDRDCRLVLTNAVYFYAKWATPFRKDQTKDEPFHVTTKESITVPMMHLTEGFRYFENKDVQVLELPYRGKQLAFIVILPRQTGDAASSVKALTAAQVSGWLAELKDYEVIVTLPKFVVRDDFRLAGELAALGMPLAFSGKADFSGMSREGRMKLEEVVHKAYVEVSEEGTKAAAATGITVQLCSAPLPRPWATFRADHPFVFLIQDRGTGSILFVGRVTKPAA